MTGKTGFWRLRPRRDYREIISRAQIKYIGPHSVRSRTNHPGPQSRQDLEYRCRPNRPADADASLRYRGWRVVAACFFVALFCWGFALYGHGVYLTELNRLHGWPTSLISGGVTCFYLLIATLVIFISDAINRFGPKRVMLLGTCCFGIGVRAAHRSSRRAVAATLSGLTC